MPIFTRSIHTLQNFRSKHGCRCGEIGMGVTKRDSRLVSLMRRIVRLSYPASGSAVAIFIALLIAILVIPGDGNPGHILIIAVCGFCGLLFWLRRRAKLLVTIGLCIVTILLSFPVAITLRDIAPELMADPCIGQSIIGWMLRFLPAALLAVGITQWLHTRSWVMIAIAVIPFGTEIGYLTCFGSA